ncbi:MAG: fluoride efflux transporter CrcB, partial [Clostridia bacterium]|nr:fluoride efflux transporter CrcB [Clostridia bacterium]
MLNCIAVGVGGFLGSVLRYLFGKIPVKELTAFPVNTLLINVLGAFIIGCIAALCARSNELDSRLLLLLKVGFCGGFTTFSTFSLETVELIDSGLWLYAVAYVLLSLFLGVAA